MNKSLQLAQEISEYLSTGMHHNTKEAQLEISKIIKKFNSVEKEIPMECRIYLENIAKEIQKTSWIWRWFMRRVFREKMEYSWEKHVDEDGKIFYASPK